METRKIKGQTQTSCRHKKIDYHKSRRFSIVPVLFPYLFAFFSYLISNIQTNGEEPRMGNRKILVLQCRFGLIFAFGVDVYIYLLFVYLFNYLSLPCPTARLTTLSRCPEIPHS